MRLHQNGHKSAFDVAGRYVGEFDGNQFVAALGFADAVPRNHVSLNNISGFPGAPASLCGYASELTDANPEQVRRVRVLQSCGARSPSSRPVAS